MSDKLLSLYTGDEIHGFMFGDYRSDEPRWIDVKQLRNAVNFVSELKSAQERVEASPLWKRFIDGTPLANDIAVWIAERVAQVAALDMALVEKLEREIFVLRQFGNKDCTAMADDYLAKGEIP
jgi:hypothetical protein